MGRNRRIARLWATTALASAGAAFSVCAYALEETDAAGVAAADFYTPPNEGEEIIFEADVVMREHDDGPIVAEGDVRAYFGERYLRADRLTYNPSTDVVTAEGNISITDEDLETMFAGRVILSGDLRDGIVENFSALLKENTRLAADNAIQEQGARTRLSRAVYTACNVCNDEGEAKTPTWRVKALRVVRDKERKVVRFHHAFIELKGVPIIYTPFLQGPDPSVERQSGFLPPRVGVSSRLGFNFELPYYLALSNSQDATFYPKFTADDGVLWQGEYRIRRRRGYHVVSAGFINFQGPSDPDEDIPGFRWNIFGRGHQDFGDHWRASYDFERVSDDTYLRRYDVERRGDLRQELDRGRTNQLRSNVRVARAGDHSRLTVDTYFFQGLRRRDMASTIPYVLPLIDYRHEFTSRPAGGRATIGANVASLYRTGGVDSQRFTAFADWERDIITPNGHRFHLFANVRGDVYAYQNLDLGTEICTSPTAACASDFPGFTDGDTSSFETRLAPTAGVEWSYPLARDLGGARLFLEPRVQLVASPSNVNDNDIINEDSQSIEFDYAGLFDYNKATGYDAFEDGQRMNVGVIASAVWPNGVAVEGSIGQQFRLQSTDAFDFSSGLGEETSNIVGSLNFRFGNHFGFENRFRLDDDNGDIQRAESMAFFRAGPLRGNVSYVRLNEENVAANLVRREELTARGKINLTDHWSMGGAWRLDLEGGRTIRQDFTVGYEDECSTFGVTLRRDRTRDTNLEPDTAVLLTFQLKSLIE